MLHEWIPEEEFFAELTELDATISARVAKVRCPYCGGPLHRSYYERKPRGGLMAMAREGFRVRHSLCCGRRGCRRRVLPPSFRFLGRRVYLEIVVILASVFAQLAPSLRRAATDTGVPRRTLHRWGAWWTEAFPTLPLWQELRASFAAPPPDEASAATTMPVLPTTPVRLRWARLRFAIISQLLSSHHHRQASSPPPSRRSPLDPGGFNELKRILFPYIEGFFNQHRLHSTLDYKSPAAKERDVLESAQAA